MKLPLTTIFLLIFSLTAFSQTRDELIAENKSLRDQLKVSNQRLVKVIDTLGAVENERDKYRDENSLLKANRELLLERDGTRLETIEAKDAEIKALRALKCEKDVYLFGLFKRVRCR